jgi:hypothetical protein
MNKEFNSYKSFDAMMKTLAKIEKMKTNLPEPTKDVVEKYITKIEKDIKDFAVLAIKCGFEDHLLIWIYILRVIQLGPKEFEKRITGPITTSIELEMAELLDEREGG